MASSFESEEIASVFKTTPPDEMILLNWIGAMRSGDYKFGYGLMRSDDDCYDAFGVLAAISVVNWSWNENEGAWAVEGEVYTPSIKQVCNWLSIPLNNDTKHIVPRFVGILIDRVNASGDSASSFEPIAKLLEVAHQSAKADKQRLAGAKESIMGRRIVGRSEYDSVLDQRPYFARY